MQILLRVGTGLAVVLAIVSVTLWRELRTERELNAGLSAQVAESTNRDPGYAPTQRIDARPDAAPATAKKSGGNPDSSPSKPAPVAATGLNIQNVLSPERDLMKDPEYRKARLTQIRMNLKRTYTDVAEELGLSEKETEQLFDILAEQQLGPNTPIPIGADGQLDRQAMEEMGRARQAAQRKQEEALLALLGPARQAKWPEYQQSLSARSRATAMSGMLATSGYPLTAEQLRPLTASLIAEEKYVRQEESTNRQLAPMTAESLAQRQEDSVNRQEESNRRYLEVAAPHMTSQQLALVRETLEQQIAMSRAAARMQRERAESQQSGAAAGTSAAGY